MSAPLPSSPRFRALVRRFSKSRRGSAAVEFALIAPLFFALIFAIMETAMVFFAGQVLETGTQDTARMLFTNQAQNSAWDQSKFKNDLCSRVSALLDCAGIAFDVKSYPAGTPANLSDPINAQGQFVSTGFSYSPPAPNSANVVVVRTFYQWPLFVTKFGYNLANIGSGNDNSKKLLTATAAFHVEPNGS
ncbi:MAG TPA: TadE/TadG family type IV pilus assembly protein [Afipia sp.]